MAREEQHNFSTCMFPRFGYHFFLKRRPDQILGYFYGYLGMRSKYVWFTVMILLSQSNLASVQSSKYFTTSMWPLSAAMSKGHFPDSMLIRIVKASELTRATKKPCSLYWLSLCNVLYNPKITGQYKIRYIHTTTRVLSLLTSNQIYPSSSRSSPK